MVVSKITDGENFRFRVPAELKRKWVAMCDDRKITQQDAITALLWYTTEQDALTQAMLLGQQPARPDLIEVVLRRLSETGVATYDTGKVKQPAPPRGQDSKARQAK